MHLVQILYILVPEGLKILYKVFLGNFCLCLSISVPASTYLPLIKKKRSDFMDLTSEIMRLNLCTTNKAP